MQKAVVIGASGAIGRAMAERLASQHPDAEIFAISQSSPSFPFPNIIPLGVAYSQEPSLANAAEHVASNGPADLVFVANGILHNQNVTPEKAWRDIQASNMLEVFTANTIVPALMVKHFLPITNRRGRAVFAAVSARVGSISDNHLGGWYSYRASKAALNMIIRSAAIEARRRNPESIVVTLHPGTVDSDLSKPFQGNVNAKKLFTPSFCAEQLHQVIAGLHPDQTGKCFAWDGAEVLP